MLLTITFLLKYQIEILQYPRRPIFLKFPNLLFAANAHVVFD